jgi:GTPase SAR1 family protein
MNLTFFETSAKDNKNVDEVFYAIARLALYHRLDSRTKAQHNHLTNGATTIQPVRLKISGKSKKKDKKHIGGCCK